MQITIDTAVPWLDDDDEHEPLSPPAFSLLDALSDENRFTGSRVLASAMRFRGHDLVEHRMVQPTGYVAIHEQVHVHHLQDGTAEVTLSSDAALLSTGGTLTREGEECTRRIVLRAGEQLRAQVPGGAVLVRLTPAPSTFRELFRTAVDLAVHDARARRVAGLALTASLVTHVVMLLAAWVLGFRAPTPVTTMIDDEFAAITMPIPVLTPPEKPIELKATRVSTRAKSPGPSSTTPRASPGRPTSGLLAALTPPARNRGSAVANALENITASPSSDRGFKTSQLIGFGPEVGLGSSRTGQHAGPSMRQVLGSAGHMEGGGTGSAEVRGTVEKGAVFRPQGVHVPIDQDAIKRIVQSHMGEVQHCYERALRNEPHLQGRLHVEWKQAANGHVLSSRVASGGLGSATDCILARIRTWRFPPTSAPVTIGFPFMFRRAAF